MAKYKQFTDPRFKKPVHLYKEFRKNARVSIGKRAINIRLPHLISGQEELQLINRFLNWAAPRVQAAEQNTAKQRQYLNGQIITVGEHQFELALKNKSLKTARLTFHFPVIRISTPTLWNSEAKQQAISKLIPKAISIHFSPILTNRVHQINKVFVNKPLGEIRLRNNQSNWGSCSVKGNLSFACRLMLAPQVVIDYVIVHELAHRIYMNHSSKFWALVESYMPNYKVHEQWLNQHGESCTF